MPVIYKKSVANNKKFWVLIENKNRKRR